MSKPLPGFVARRVVIQDDGEVAMVGFADDEYETRIYVLLQRTLHPVEQDVAAGQDEVHITVCDESRSRYGGIRQIRVDDKHVVVAFSEDAAMDLETAREVTIDISSAGVNMQSLMAGLKTVCHERVPLNET